MERQKELALVERALAHVEARTTDRDPAPTTIPSAAYSDPARHERELATLFRRLPLPIGRGLAIPNPGDYFVHDDTGAPILVVRGDDGSVSAFLNVCRHRGTRLAQAPCGHAKAFVCPYHSWTYDRDGSLLGIPHKDGFDGIDRKTRGLVRLPCAEKLGFVWVAPSPTAPALDLDAWLGELAADLDSFGITKAHAHRSETRVKELSWKLAVDVFLESYHLKPTHGRSIYDLFFDNIGLVDRVGPHLRTVFPKRSIKELRDRPRSEWSLRHNGNVLFHLFPCTLVLVEPDHAAFVQFLPDGPSRTRVTTYMLLGEKPETEKALAYWKANDDILRSATEEDFAMGESIQKGLSSGANESFVFGAFEHALAHFHAQVERFAG